MPRAPDKPPTVELVRELYTHNLDYWAPQVAVDRLIRQEILNEHVVLVPDTQDKRRKLRTDPEKMTSGIGPHAVTLISSLYQQPAPITVRDTSESPRGATAGEDVEIALAEARDQLNPATDSPRSRELKHMIGLGRRCQLILPGTAYWYDTPRFQEAHYEQETNVEYMARLRVWKSKAPLPILWQDLPPETTFPPSLGSVDDMVLSHTIMTWWEMLDVFAESEFGQVLPKPEERHKFVTLATYADRFHIGWYILAAATTPRYRLAGFGLGSTGFPDHQLRVIEHKMGRCPIRIIAGRTGAFKEPGLYWQSALFNVRHMIPQVDARFSEAATASKFASMPWLKYTRNRRADETPSDARARIQEQLGGDMVVIDAGGDGEPAENIEGIFLPPFGDKTLALAQFELDLIRRMTGATESIEGLPGPASQTAWARSFTAELAKGFFKEITDNVVAADIDTMEQIIRATVAFGEDIVLQRHDEVGGQIVLKHDEIGNFEPNLKGVYKLRIPQNRRADIEQAISMMERVKQSDLPIDQFWIMEEFLGVDQPNQMYKDALKTQFILSPELKAWHMQQLLRDADVGVAQREGMSLTDFEGDPRNAVIPDNIRNLIRQRAGGTQAQRDLQGSNRAAGAPGDAIGPGGPQPQEESG